MEVSSVALDKNQLIVASRLVICLYNEIKFFLNVSNKEHHKDAWICTRKSRLAMVVVEVA